MVEVLNKILDVALVAALIIAAFVAIDVAGVITNEPAEMPYEPTTAPTVATTQEPTQVPTETTYPVTDATEPVETTATTEPPITLYDVPLATDLQLHIISEAESHGIDPAIIFAMAFRESTFNPKAMGDEGQSYGLLQVQLRFHKERMQKLGCADLLDPYQNVTVGVDFLSELLSRYGSIEVALTAYNWGHFPGYVTEYARTVLAVAEELRGEAH